MFGQGTPTPGLIGELVKDLTTRPDSLHLAVAMIVARERRPVSFGLLIDQFEELFTICDDQDSRSAFIDNLVHAVTVAPPHIYLLPDYMCELLCGIPLPNGGFTEVYY